MSHSKLVEIEADNFREDCMKYLERNAINLQNQAIKMKEFENRLLHKEIKNEQYELALMDVQNICHSTCEAIDVFFKSFSASLNLFKNVLMWKSQVLQIPKKFEVAFNPDMSEFNITSGSSNSDSNLSTLNENNQNRIGRKCGTAKVSPMIKGHVISAPRIHLSRLNEGLEPQSRRSSIPLSPIIEQSPEASPEASNPIFRNIRIPLHRLNIENLGNGSSYRTEGSPNISFTNRKCRSLELRKRYSLLGLRERFQMMGKRPVENVNESKNEEDVTDGDIMNEESPKYSPEVVESPAVNGETISEGMDPLEGPSWLLDQQPGLEKSHSRLSPLQCKFVNFKRPTYKRSAEVQKNDEKRDLLNFNDDAQMGNFERTPSCSPSILEHSFPLRRSSLKNSSFKNEVSSAEHHSILLFAKPQIQRGSMNDGAYSPVVTKQKPSPRRSVKSVRKSSGRDYSCGGINDSKLLMDCSVVMYKTPDKIVASGETRNGPNKSERGGDEEEKMDSTVVRKRKGRNPKRVFINFKPPISRLKNCLPEQCTEKEASVSISQSKKPRMRQAKAKAKEMIKASYEI